MFFRQLLGDIPAESSIDKSALFNEKAQDDLVEEEEEELLTSGIENIVEDSANVSEEIIPPNQFSSDSSDLDDDELLTSGLDDEPLTKVEEPVSKIDDESEFKECLAVVHDDDDFSDEDLLAD